MADTPVNYPALGNMFGEASAMPAFLGTQQFNQALGQAQQNQQLQMQQEQRTAQMHPLEMLLRQAQTRHQNASSDLLGQQVREGAFKNDMNDATKKQQLDVLLSKYAKEKSANELETAHNSIEMTLADDSIKPEHRQKLLELSQFFQKAREKQAELKAQRDQAEAVAHIQGGYHVQQANIAANAGIERARIMAEARKKQAGSLLDSVKAGKMDPQKALATFNILAEFEQDPVEKRHYQDLANQMEVIIQKQKQAGANAVPQVNPEKVPGAPLTTPQPPAATPRGGAAEPAAATVNKQTVEAAGWPYEPDKYDYRVMDGKVQRKPKGK